MVNGNPYPLSSVLWIIAVAENDSCRPRRGRCGRTSEGKTARPIRSPPAFVSGFDTRIPGSISQGISAMSNLFIGVASHIYLVGKIECLSSTLAQRSKLVRRINPPRVRFIKTDITVEKVMSVCPKSE